MGLAMSVAECLWGGPGLSIWSCDLRNMEALSLLRACARLGFSAFMPGAPGLSTVSSKW